MDRQTGAFVSAHTAAHQCPAARAIADTNAGWWGWANRSSMPSSVWQVLGMVFKTSASRSSQRRVPER